MSGHPSRGAAAASIALLVWCLVLTSTLLWQPGAAAVVQSNTNAPATPQEWMAAPLPLDVEVQDLVAPALAMGLGPMGGAAYTTTNLPDGFPVPSPVCARADAGAMMAPLTVTTIDALYFSLNGGDARLDVINRCYMNVSQPQQPDGNPSVCVATPISTGDDCGGRATDAVDAYLEVDSASRGTGLFDPPTSARLLPSSAAVLASYVGEWGAQRLTLERSLRRTREAVTMLARVNALVQAAASVSADAEDFGLLCLRAAAHVTEVVAAALHRVEEKYAVVTAWGGPSLGIVAGDTGSGGSSSGVPVASSTAVGPAVADWCAVSDYVQRLLSGKEAQSTVLMDVIRATLTAADLVHNRTIQPAVRGLECAQVLTAVAMMALEDEVVRMLGAEMSSSASSNASAASLSDFAMLALDRNAEQRRRQLWSLAFTFAVVADPAMAEELVGGVSVAECMRRAALVVPDSLTGTVPPSIYWCLYNSSMTEMTLTAVRERAVAVREDATSANGHCLWGLTVWDGLCGDAVFDPSRCEACPPGSVGDGEGHCVCGDSTALYVTLTDGCVAKGVAHGQPGIRILHSGGTVALSGDHPSVDLFEARLPQTALQSDPSAFLRVDVVCTEYGHDDGSGGTRLTASPSGSRRASCETAVGYERQEERTGAAFTFGGHQRFVTYAETITISATGSAAFYGETCTFTVTTGSTTQRASQPIVAGTWIFIPAAELPHLVVAEPLLQALPATAEPALVSTLSCRHVMLNQSAWIVPDPAGVAQVGVCFADDFQPAVYVSPGAFDTFGRSTQEVISARVRHRIGTTVDRAFLTAVQSLTRKTGMRVQLEGSTPEDAVWSATWTPKVTPLSAVAWSRGWYGTLPADQLNTVHTLRVQLFDVTAGSAFVAVEKAVPFRYGAEPTRGAASSLGRSNEGGAELSHPPSISPEEYDVQYVVGIVVTAVLLTALVGAFGFFVYAYVTEGALLRRPFK